MGYQAYLLVNNLVGFWLVGMTSAAILAFKFEMGIAGLWVGTIAGVLVSALLNTFMLLRVDWKVTAFSWHFPASSGSVSVYRASFIIVQRF